jgi:hypothetical protein
MAGMPQLIAQSRVVARVMVGAVVQKGERIKTA